MDGHLKHGADGHLLRKTDGHLANTCSCGCVGHGPITATIVMDSGTCTCDATCGGGEVVSLTWSASPTPGWYGSDGSPCTWDVVVGCVDGVWTLYVSEGLTLTAWEKVFVPEGCEEDGADGYPTHSGINTGIPTTVGSCGATCFLVVALS